MEERHDHTGNEPSPAPAGENASPGGASPRTGADKPPSTGKFVSSRRRRGKRFLVTVRYGKMCRTDDFIGFFNRGLRPGAECVVKTSRGTEFGVIVAGPEELSPEEERNVGGRILRLAVDEDVRRRKYIESRLEPEEMKVCRARVRDHGLPMKVVAAEHVLGGEKIIFYFVAERRVDFRALVRELAEEFHTRIELRQIGVRDEARILAECGHCGRPLCCHAFMRKIEPVGMKQAKQQKITDPTKMSGRCGRLMCCLRFEAETYASLASRMPKKGTPVTHLGKQWSVTDSDPIGRKLFLADADNNRVTVRLEELGLPNPEDEDLSALPSLPASPPPSPPSETPVKPQQRSKPAGTAAEQTDRPGRKPRRNRRRRKRPRKSGGNRNEGRPR